ncbi:MAG: cysteine peptidase family C39 domain-containing protein [Acidobacteriota bacterium]
MQNPAQTASPAFEDTVSVPSEASRDENGSDLVPFVPQRAVNDCGPACLAMALAYFGRVTELDEVVACTGLRESGVDVHSLLEAARRLGLDGEGVRLDDASTLAIAPPGSILHWAQGRSTGGHFVVLEASLPGGGARIVDPAYGRRTLRKRTLSRNFSGVVLVLAPGPHFQPRPGDVPPIPMRKLVGLRAVYRWQRLIAFLRPAVIRPAPPRPAPTAADPPGSEP